MPWRAGRWRDHQQSDGQFLASCRGRAGRAASFCSSTQVAPERIDRLRPLTDQKCADAKDHCGPLGLFALHGHEPHRRAHCCFTDRLRISQKSVEVIIADPEKMGWMPRSPNGIAMCQACDVKAQDKTGDGIHGRSYHHRDGDRGIRAADGDLPARARLRRLARSRAATELVRRQGAAGEGLEGRPARHPAIAGGRRHGRDGGRLPTGHPRGHVARQLMLRKPPHPRGHRTR